MDYRLGFGVDRANTERKLADRDGDFQVSTLEANARLDRRTAELVAATSVCVGRTRDALSCRPLKPSEVVRVEAEGWSPGPTGHLHITWRLELTERPARLGAFELQDGYSVEGVDVTDVTITPPAGVTPLAAGDPAGKLGAATLRWTWVEANRPAGPRRVLVTWPPPREALDRLLLGVAALAIAGLLFGLWLRRRPPTLPSSPQ